MYNKFNVHKFYYVTYRPTQLHDMKGGKLAQPDWCNEKIQNLTEIYAWRNV